MPAKSIQHLTIKGTARDRGTAHGEGLRDNIAQAITVYGDLFALSGIDREETFRRAAHFRSVINSFSPAYAEEIEGIAEGAGQDPLWLFALNARSELMSSKGVDFGECTAFFFNRTSVLAQNWDWAAPIEPLIALITIERDDGPDILMMTEPGLIGKIGMNEAGLGLCFNFLATDKPTNGVPLHVMNRAILESATLDEARNAIDRAGPGRSGNILVGQSDGTGFDMEFAGDRTILPDPAVGYFTHTNHFIDEHYHSSDPSLVENSKTRQARVDALCSAVQDQSVAAARQVLNDQASVPHPILRPYEPHPELGEGGTVCTIIMDLPAREMHFRLGNEVTDDFTVYRV